jgi:hypothetical protein
VLILMGDRVLTTDNPPKLKTIPMKAKTQLNVRRDAQACIQSVEVMTSMMLFPLRSSEMPWLRTRFSNYGAQLRSPF